MNAWQIDQRIPVFRSRRLTIPQHFNAAIEISRLVYGEQSGLWVDSVHAQLRWSRFALLWCAIGAQRQVEAVLR